MGLHRITIAARARGIKSDDTDERVVARLMQCNVELDTHGSFCERFVKRLKTIDWRERHYDKETKRWFFFAKHFSKVVELAREETFFDDVEIVELSGRTFFLRQNTSQLSIFDAEVRADAE